MNPGPVVFLGIDGGATHSFGVAVDRDGQVLGTARAGPLNYFGSGFQEARRHLAQLVATLRAGLAPNVEILRAVIGCAALFTEATPQEQRQLCGDLLPQDRTRVVSDVMTAFYGASLGQPGVLVIAGTGSMVLARNEAGRTEIIGGWGHLIGDEGSAWWMAREAVRAAIAEAESRGPATRLSQWVPRWFGVGDLLDIVPILHRPEFTKEKFAALARFLSQNVEPGDEVFGEIRRRAGRELAAQALVAIQRAALARPVSLYLVGGVVEHDASVREGLLATLREKIEVRHEPPRLPPVLGAAVLAMNDGGTTPTPEAINRLQDFKRIA